MLCIVIVPCHPPPRGPYSSYAASLPGTGPSGAGMGVPRARPGLSQAARGGEGGVRYTF